MGMPSVGPELSDAGMDMSNYTVAYDFLQDILDDSLLQPYDYALSRAFWYGIMIVIGLAATANLVRWTTLRARIRAAASNRSRPASPTNPISSVIASFTALAREISYPQITPSMSSWIRIPPFGTILLVAVYLGFVLGLLFFENNYSGAQHWEAKGLRAAWLTMAQIPLLLLLAGKNNLIGFAVGVSYERLQVLHRWVARTILLTATLHGAYQSYGWAKFGVLQIEIQTDSCIPTGFATWMILLWLIFSSFAPIRNWWYEFFVVQHVISFLGLTVSIFYHIPLPYAIRARIYAWIAVGLFLFDRLTRLSRFCLNNFNPGKAALYGQYGDVTKVCVKSPRISHWSPGQHVFLCLPRLGLWQSHPATIASIPSSHSGDLVFFLRAHKGFTKKLQDKAEKAELTCDANSRMDCKFLALIDGPYGGSHSDFAAFDTVLLISGSTGVTFTLPILLDIAHRASTQKLAIRRIMFVWLVKNVGYSDCIVPELRNAFDALHAVGLEIDVEIFVTRDSILSGTASNVSDEKLGCQGKNLSGPCCSDGNSEEKSSDAAAATMVSLEQNGFVSNIVSESSAAKQQSADKIEGGDKNGPRPSTLQATELRHPSLPFAILRSGRPSFKPLLRDLLDHAVGETGIAVCGPLGLSACIRTTVAALSDQRAVSMGTGAYGIYLHAECFGW